MAMAGTFPSETATPKGARRVWLTFDLDGSAASRLWVQGGLLLLAALVPTLIAYGIDDRLLNGVSVWTKPMKFQLSVALHLATLAVATTLLAGRVRHGRLIRVTAWASTAAAIFEIGYITIQAARGRASHFNSETPFEVAMYAAMGVGALMLVAASTVVGVLLLRAPRDGVGAGLRWGGGVGLILGSVATLAVAGYMSQLGSHWIGGVASDAGGMPVTGWSTTGGDIRVSHFLATHMMQGLPLIGLAADRLGRDGRATALAAGGLWLALVAATFVQAALGRPLL